MDEPEDNDRIELIDHLFAEVAAAPEEAHEIASQGQGRALQRTRRKELSSALMNSLNSATVLSSAISELTR